MESPNLSPSWMGSFVCPQSSWSSRVFRTKKSVLGVTGTCGLHQGPGVREAVLLLLLSRKVLARGLCPEECVPPLSGGLGAGSQRGVLLLTEMSSSWSQKERGLGTCMEGVVAWPMGPLPARPWQFEPSRA